MLTRNGNGPCSAPPPLPYLTPERAADAGLLKNERLGVAAATCSEISRLVLSELELAITGASCPKNAAGTLKKSVEAACRLGEVALKPYRSGKGGGTGIETVGPDRFRVLSKDPSGTPRRAEFVSGAVKNGRFYKRRELHELGDGIYTVTNSVTSEDLSTGRIENARLSDVPEWAEMSPKTVIKNVSSPLFSVFRAAEDGAPLFRRGEKLIAEIEKQFDRLIWEYEGGELAVDASVDAFRMGKDGRPELPKGKERLWRTNMLDACSSQSELFKIFNPELRDASYIRGLDRLLMHYEDAVGLARGTFSDPLAVARSATEVRASRQKTFSLAERVRRGFFAALDGLTDALDVFGTLYDGGRPGQTGIKVTYGDGLTDGGTKTYETGGTERRTDDGRDTENR